jgi:branched-chain amino acid transport system ATP-binding protein
MAEERSSTEAQRPGGGTLRAAAVSRRFEGLRALEGVTLELHRHEVVGLIGPNGAGKTTLVNLITGFDFPDSGSVVLDGETITGWPAHRRARAGLARTFQQGHLYRGLSVRENVEVSALGVGGRVRDAQARASELLEMLGLAGRADQPAAILPHGEERKLGVARALATRPSFVLMDEPAAGLHEGEVEEFAQVVRRVRDERQAGVLLIDHNIGLILGVCDRIHVLDEGKTLAEGTPAEIRANLDVATAYLGRRAVIEDGTGG